MIVKNKLVAGALALSLFATPIVAVQAASTSDTSEALAECLYKHATASDKQVLVQWAYVTLSKTSAAKQIQTIPSAKVKNIEAMCMLDIANRIITPAVIKYSKVVADETMTLLAGKLVNAEIERRASPILSLTMTDLMGLRK